MKPLQDQPAQRHYGIVRGMMRVKALSLPPARIFPLLMLLAPAAACAEGPASQTPVQPGTGILLAYGLGVFIAGLAAFLAYFAIFIHVATRIVGLDKPFGTAFKAEFFYIGLAILFSVAAELLAPGSELAHFLASWGAASGAIRYAYETGFLRSLLAAVLTMVLTVIGTLATLFVLIMVLGISAPPAGNPPPPPPPPIIRA